MSTIEELRREIAKEKNKQSNISEINKLGREKAKLEQELKQLKYQNRYGERDENIKNIWGGVKTAFGKIQTEVGKLQQEQIRRDKQHKRIF